jgi:hypothetical protein
MKQHKNTTPDACEQRKTLVVMAPKNLKKAFIVMFIKMNTIKNVKNLPALRLRPVIK